MKSVDSKKKQSKQVAILWLTLPLFLAACSGNTRGGQVVGDPRLTGPQPGANTYLGAKPQTFVPSGPRRPTGPSQASTNPGGNGGLNDCQCMEYKNRSGKAEVQCSMSINGRWIPTDPSQCKNSGKSDATKTDAEKEADAKKKAEDEAAAAKAKAENQAQIKELRQKAGVSGYSWKEICSEAKIGNEVVDLTKPPHIKADYDKDLIPDECESYIMDNGILPGINPKVFNGYRVSAIKIDEGVINQALNDAGFVNMEPDSTWKKLKDFRRHFQKISEANEALMTLIAFLQDRGMSSIDIIDTLVKASNTVHAADAPNAPKPYFMVDPSLAKSRMETAELSRGVAVIRGGSEEPLVYSPEFMKGFSPSMFTGLAKTTSSVYNPNERELFMLLIESKTFVKDRLPIKISRLESNGAPVGRSAGGFFVFEEGNMETSTLDFGKVPSQPREFLEHQNEEGTLDPDAEGKHFMMGLIAQDVSKEELSQLINENVAISYDGGANWFPLPQEIAQANLGEDFQLSPNGDTRILSDVKMKNTGGEPAVYKPAAQVPASSGAAAPAAPAAPATTGAAATAPATTAAVAAPATTAVVSAPATTSAKTKGKAKSSGSKTSKGEVSKSKISDVPNTDDLYQSAPVAPSPTSAVAKPPTTAVVAQAKPPESVGPSAPPIATYPGEVIELTNKSDAISKLNNLRYGLGKGSQNAGKGGYVHDKAVEKWQATVAAYDLAIAELNSFPDKQMPTSQVQIAYGRLNAKLSLIQANATGGKIDQILADHISQLSKDSESSSGTQTASRK